jgi:hypothetical protein
MEINYAIEHLFYLSFDLGLSLKLIPAVPILLVEA